MIFYKLSRALFFTGLFLLPLLFIPTRVNGFEGTKVWFFQWWVLILAICFSFWNLKFGVKNQNRILLVLVFLYFFWSLLTCLFGIDPNNSFYGLFWREQGLITLACYVGMVWIIVNLFRRRDLKVFAKVLVSSGFSACLFVFLNILGNMWWDIPIYKYLDREVGTLGNPNFLAGILVIIFPCIFVVRNFWIKMLLCLTYFFIIYLTGSRGAILALGFGGVFLLWLKSVQKFKTLGILIGVVCCFGFSYWLIPWVNKIPWTDPNFAASRQRVWVRGYRAFVKKPVLGYGLENYSLAVSNIVYPGGLNPPGEVYADKAHNETLEVLIGGGIPALVIWMAIFLYALRNYYHNKNYIFLVALVIFFIKAQTNVVSVSEYVLYWGLVGFSAVRVRD